MLTKKQIFLTKEELEISTMYEPTHDHRVPLLDNVSQKRHCEVVVGNVPSIKQQAAIRVPFLCCGQRDFTVLHHLVNTIHTTHHTNWLCGVGLFNYLQQTREELCDFANLWGGGIQIFLKFTTKSKENTGFILKFLFTQHQPWNMALYK